MDNILLKEALIMANSNMCRLCLSANGMTEPLCYDQRDQFLIQKIYECTSLHITPLTGLPSAICTICRTRLDEFYQFRWQCLKNDEIMRRIANNMQKAGPSFNKPESEIQISRIEGNQQYTAPVKNNLEDAAAAHYQPTPQIQIIARPESTNVQTPQPQQQQQQPPPIQQPPQNHFGAIGVSSQIVAIEVSGRDLMNSFHSIQMPQHNIDSGESRRKRGRPPKQKYDYYPRYAADELHSVKSQNSMECSNTSTVNQEHFNDAPSPGERNSFNPSMYAEHKVKMEQGEQLRYENSELGESKFNPQQNFERRQRGRPPRDGGYMNQDKEEYRFQCQFCDAKFRASINLKLHTNTHTGERPYKCQLCDKAFAHPSNLSVHTKLHTLDRVKKENGIPEKKYQCPFCHTLFALAFQLKIHINTHTGEKPYTCKNCGKSFAQPSNLHVHIKKHCHKRQEDESQVL